MAADAEDTRRVRGFCGLCIARCGTVATVESGRFTRLDPDPEHPTGAAICAKVRAAPELVYSTDRLARPLRRRGPKGDADPRWEEIPTSRPQSTSILGSRPLRPASASARSCASTSPSLSGKAGDEVASPC